MIRWSVRPLKYWAESDKPPWIGANEKEKRWMHEWVLGTPINDEYEDALAEPPDAYDDATAKKALLEYGDPEPLRERYPSLKEVINPPTLKPGQTWKKKSGFSWDDPHADPRVRLKFAMTEQPLIRNIWKTWYGLNHRPSGQPTPAEILAERWDLEENEVREKQLSRERLKKLKAT